MNEELTKFLREISQKLNILVALELSKDKKKLSEKVKFLLDFGLTNQQIAEILGTSKGSIEVIKSRLKKKLDNKCFQNNRKKNFKRNF
jgi:DNA-binding NarL/FixJ family response regulator